MLNYMTSTSDVHIMHLTIGQAAQALQEDMHCKYVQLVCTANEGNRLSTASML